MYNYNRIQLRGMGVGLLRQNLACGRGLYVKEHDEINVLVFFFQKKNLKMISRYDTMHCEFVYLVNESIFSSFRLDLMPHCSPNFKIRTRCGPTLP